MRVYSLTQYFRILSCVYHCNNIQNADYTKNVKKHFVSYLNSTDNIYNSFSSVTIPIR